MSSLTECTPLPNPKINFFYGFCKICFYRGLDTYIKGWNPEDEVPIFKTRPWRFFLKIWQKLAKIVENINFAIWKIVFSNRER